MKDHSISVHQARYSSSILANYLENSTFNTSKKFYKTNFPSAMIFNKGFAYTSCEIVKKFTREFNIQYRTCSGSLIYLLYKKNGFKFVSTQLS